MSDLTVEKIQQMIKDDVEESSGLDWKRSDSLIESRSASREKIKTELSKDVSSFANAAGGRLIYGVVEAPDPPHCPMNFDEGLDSAEVTKEWIDDVISSRIHPPISGVKIIPVPLDPIRPGRCAYVIEVPQSHTVHQAFDRRYYRRRNFKAEPMEDYEIREGISRGLNPVLIPFFELKFIRSREFGDERQLIVHVRNDGNVRVRDFMFEIDLRSDMVSDTFSVGRDLRNAIDLQISDIKVDGNAYKKLRIKLIGGLDIIFPQETIELAATGFRVILYVRTDRNHPSSQVYWRIYADNTRPRSGNLPVHEIPHVS